MSADEPVVPDDRPKVLIIDDVPANLRVLSEILHDDYRLFMATSGWDGLLVAGREPEIDLILLDLIMPELDGYQVCERLKVDPLTRRIPVIFITAADAEWNEPRGFQLGAVDFLTKPVRAPVVRARVKTHVELKRQRDLLSSSARDLELRVAERTRELQVTIELLSTEIAHRHQVEQQLSASRLQLQAIVDTAAEGIITIGETGIMEFANSAVEVMFGYSGAELSGRNVKLLMTGADREHHDEYLRNFVADRRPIHGGSCREVIGRRKDGTLFPLELSVAELRLGERRLFTGILREITQRKRAEEFAIRSARLASLGTLAAGVAHEINNPNNAIGFAASTMTRLWNGVAPRLDEYRAERGEFEVCGLPAAEGMETMGTMIREIEENSRRIAAIIANLKHMARGDVGNLNQLVEVNQVVQSAIGILKNVIRNHTHRFACELGEGLPRVRGNGQQLEQVFINLIQNGLQSLPDPERGVLVTSLVTVVEQRELVAVRIMDEGSGIDRERLELITRPFYTTKAEEGGIGLGLSITKTILDNHGGSMKFESLPGRGTLVIVSLPVVPESGTKSLQTR